LGLAISRDFIEAQGGQIKASSSPGEGSLFEFDLPVKQPAE
jgi:signal transduction histidine kinase